MKTQSVIFCILFLGFLIVVGLLACSPPEASSVQPSATAKVSQIIQTNSPLATATPAETDTPQSLTIEDLAFEPTVEIGPTNESILAQELTFATPLPTNAVDWRPPLYDIPWAPGPNDHFYFLRPIAVNEVNWPLPDYRYGGTFFAPDIVHTGIDIDATRGTPVLAAAAGRVVWAGTGLYFGVYNPDDPYGLAVVIEHDFGYENNTLYTVYAHMDDIIINLGERIEAHQPIGIVGNTGFTTGPHLHFEIRVGNNNFYQTRNPELWISPPQGWGIAAARIMNQSLGPIEKLDVKLTNLITRKTYQARTYTMNGVNSDNYYRENFVLSDLPAGSYQVSFDYKEQNYVHTIEINPGVVTYFTFTPKNGFSDDPPQAENSAYGFLPEIGNN